MPAVAENNKGKVETKSKFSSLTMTIVYTIEN
jgi:hypothetical protein